MINFLLGFWTADLLFSLILLIKREIFLKLDQRLIILAILVDLFLIIFLLSLKYGKLRKS